MPQAVQIKTAAWGPRGELAFERREDALHESVADTNGVCHMPFPFPGLAKAGTFTNAGQSDRRDRCYHSVPRPPSNLHPSPRCTTD